MHEGCESTPMRTQGTHVCLVRTHQGHVCASLSISNVEARQNQAYAVCVWLMARTRVCNFRASAMPLHPNREAVSCMNPEGFSIAFGYCSILNVSKRETMRERRGSYTGCVVGCIPSSCWTIERMNWKISLWT